MEVETGMVRWSRYFWMALLTGAGLSHFVLDDFLLAQMPGYFPYPMALIHLSGFFELVLAAGLAYPPSRPKSWVLVAAMCAAYLPVHWHVAWHCEALSVLNGAFHIPCWLAWLRLPVQIVFIGWAGWLARIAAKQR